MALDRAGTHPIGPTGSVQGIQGAHDFELNNSYINVIGGDNHTHTHFHYRDAVNKLKAILDGISNFRQIQQDTLAKSTPGTVLWLLECKEFRLFIDVDGHLKILWGSGMPGAGKTVLASIVINRLEALARESNGETCVAYAYIRYSDQDQVTVRGILECLVKQTIERHPDCVPLAQQAYDIHLREGTRPSEEELHQLLSQFAKKKRATFYVLDALDEAPDKIRLRLIQRLSSLGVRLFITSRPLPALEAKFPSAHTFPILAQDGDLDLHIEDKISSSEHLQDLLEQGDPTFKDNLISTVKSKCGGMFLHASLQLDALQDCFTVHDATQTLDAFPPRIEDVYHRTWNRILKSDQHQASLAKVTFEWVLNAQQSMTLDQLRCALATCPETYHFQPTRIMPEAVILAACRGLVTIDKESKLVRLVHYTAKEPLEGLLLSSVPHPHPLLAAVCVTCLADGGFQNTNIKSKQELDKALEGDPLLAYAYRNWVAHTQKSLDADLTHGIVSAFIADCRTLPVMVKIEPFGDSVDLLSSLHIVGFFGFPLEYAGPYGTDAINALSSEEKMTPLHLACRQGHCATAQSLLRLPDTLVNLIDHGEGWTALMYASRYGHEGIVRLILARPEIQVNLTESGGWTALLYASAYGHESIAKLLLSHSEIRVNLANNSGWTSLMCASWNGHKAIVRLLLTRPELHLEDNNGQAALILASWNGHECIVKLLLAHRETQINATNSGGWTALIVASREGYEGIVKILLAHPDIQVNLADSDGETALMRASWSGHEPIVKLLLAHPDIDVDLADSHGSNPLLVATEAGHTRVVEELLTAPDIDINSVDGDGDTAVKIAAEYGYKDIVRILLDVPGINTSVVSTRDGYSAMSAAVSKYHHEIVWLLDQFQATTAGPPVTTREDIESHYESDSLDHTLSEYFDELDRTAEDAEAQNEEGDRAVHELESDGSDVYEDAMEDL